MLKLRYEKNDDNGSDIWKYPRTSSTDACLNVIKAGPGAGGPCSAWEVRKQLELHGRPGKVRLPKSHLTSYGRPVGEVLDGGVPGRGAR